MSDALSEWLRALEARHLADLRFSEVSRALRALSATYVERRDRISRGEVFTGAGKRAAFALFYGPLHFLLVRQIIAELGGAPTVSTIVDLGCGTGAAGAAWASAGQPGAALVGVDLNRWALGEARETYRHFGVSARTVVERIERVRWPSASPLGLVAAFAVNEMNEPDRGVVLSSLLERATRGDKVLIVEPLARGVAPWWGSWRSAFEQAGGRADEWRFRLALPAIVAKLDRAAGLDHRELTGRSLSLF